MLTSFLAGWIAVCMTLVMLIVVASAVRHLRIRLAITRMTAAAQRHANSGVR